MNHLNNIKAFLDAIAWAEIGPRLLALSDNGYNVCVGSTPTNPILFDSYSRHPMIRNKATNSDAAGRYQFMGRYWPFYQKLLKLPDFGKESQDKWAVHLIKECHALDDVKAGRFDEAVHKCRSRWASFPGANYGQPEKKIAALRTAYERAGGGIAA